MNEESKEDEVTNENQVDCAASLVSHFRHPKPTKQGDNGFTEAVHH